MAMPPAAAVDLFSTLHGAGESHTLAMELPLLCAAMAPMPPGQPTRALFERRAMIMPPNLAALSLSNPPTKVRYMLLGSSPRSGRLRYLLETLPSSPMSSAWLTSGAWPARTSPLGLQASRPCCSPSL